MALDFNQISMMPGFGGGKGAKDPIEPNKDDLSKIFEKATDKNADQLIKAVSAIIPVPLPSSLMATGIFAGLSTEGWASRTINEGAKQLTVNGGTAYNGTLGILAKNRDIVNLVGDQIAPLQALLSDIAEAFGSTGGVYSGDVVTGTPVAAPPAGVGGGTVGGPAFD